MIASYWGFSSQGYNRHTFHYCFYFTAFVILLLMAYNAYQHSWKPEPGKCVRSDVCQISGILYTKRDY